MLEMGALKNEIYFRIFLDTLCKGRGKRAERSGRLSLPMAS